MNTKKTHPRILLVDMFWPTPYAKWRIEEINSFVKNYQNVDILTIYYQWLQSDPSGPTKFEIHKVNEIFPLQDYYFMSLQPSNNSIVNQLNEFADNQYDGSCTNAYIPESNNTRFKTVYLLRQKKTSNEKWDILNYDCIYHIFLYIHDNMMRPLFPNYPIHKCMIHLHVGGGVRKSTKFGNIKDIGGAVVTQHDVHCRLLNDGYPKEKIIKCYGNTILQKDFTPCPKRLKSIAEPLKVVYCALGPSKIKGHHLYQEIINLFKQKYPNYNVDFYIVGNNPNIKNAISMGKMTQHDLDKFYQEQIDIYLNPEIGDIEHYNGFPLGTEAAIQGCVLCTTDPNNYNQISEFNFQNDEMLICNDNVVEKFVGKIAELHLDREKLLSMSNKSQQRFYEIFRYENQQAKIFDYINTYF